jgi:hypothetical protein
MKHLRALLLTLTTTFVATTLILTPVFAEQLFGVITKVDPDANEVVLVPSDRKAAERKIKTTPNTEIVSAKGKTIGLKALDEVVQKEQAAGKKGTFAKVTHENNVASKITVGLPAAEKAK